MATQQFLQTQPLNYLATIVAADGVAKKDLLPAGIACRTIDQILVSNTDVIDHTLDFYLVVGGVEVPIGSFVSTAGAGTNGTQSVDALPQVIASAQPLCALEPATLLRVAAHVAVTLANQVSVVLLGASV
jgi:hypothetical protein